MTIIELPGLTDSQGFILLGDAHDSAGYSVSSAGDINGDGIDDLIVGAIQYSNYSSVTGSGRAYVIYGRAGATREDIDLGVLDASTGFAINGAADTDFTGFSVSDAGDVNGDGIDDLIVGAPFANSPGSVDAGASYVIFGKAGTARPSIDLANLAATDGFAIRGDAESDRSGYSVSSAGDINGDGIADLIVGAVQYGYYSYSGDGSGKAYVIYGTPGATRADVDLGSLAASDGFVIDGITTNDFAGFSVSDAGDINGDGIADVIISAPFSDGGGNLAGASYVVFGKTGSTRASIDLASLAAGDGFAIQGGAPEDRSGFSVSSAGDINGDGIDDLIVGAPSRNGAGGNYDGAAYVIFGKAGATRPAIDLDSLAASDGFVIQGAANVAAGFSVSGAGDIDGDGIDDLIVGAPFLLYHGAAYVVFGQAGAQRETVDLGNLDPADGFMLRGRLYTYAGTSVSSAGDVNGDGFADVIVGSSDYSTSAAAFSGAAYVVYGAAALSAAEPPVNQPGTASNDTIVGTVWNDIFTGLAGDDTLVGGIGADSLDGGDGADRLLGGVGNDSYFVERQDDLVFEAAGQGFDTVNTTASYYLYAEIEALALAAGAGDLFGVGNALDNVLIGNEGANTLIGYGGRDRIDGGSGADTLFGVDGDDSLTGGSGNAVDILVGGEGNDTLRGDSGQGEADLLYGNAGDDTFWVDAAGDLVFEQAGEGSADTVHAAIAGGGYYLYANIENLTLAGTAGFGVGNGLDNALIGNASANLLLGGLGNDMLNGRGGGDVLFGEGGADVFVFEQGTGGDVIGDFLAGTDRIDLGTIFTSFQQAQSNFVQNGSDGAINLGGGDFIVLNNVTMSQLTAADFIFG